MFATSTSSAACGRCGRPLKDPVSVARGLGPVCAGKDAAERGQVQESGVTVTVDGRPLTHIVYHSPTGMEWGYGGSGPADLALSILADYLGEQEAVKQYLRDIEAGQLATFRPRSVELHQRFKWDFVARFDRQSWRLHGTEIAAWLRSHGIDVPAINVVYEGRRA